MRVKQFNAIPKKHFHFKTIKEKLDKLKSKPFSRPVRNPRDYLT